MFFSQPDLVQHAVHKIIWFISSNWSQIGVIMRSYCSLNCFWMTTCWKCSMGFNASKICCQHFVSWPTTNITKQLKGSVIQRADFFHSSSKGVFLFSLRNVNKRHQLLSFSHFLSWSFTIFYASYLAFYVVETAVIKQSTEGNWTKKNVILKLHKQLESF